MMPRPRNCMPRRRRSPPPSRSMISRPRSCRPRQASGRCAIATHDATDGRGVAARPVYIVDGSRTPFIRARGRPGPFTPVDLAVACGRPLLLRQPFAPDAFDQVILGCVNVLADEMNPARIAALRLGMGEAMTAFTVQINCGSGMQSIDTAYQYIREGHSDLILAGGAEALSQSPLLFRKSAVDWYARLVRRARHLVPPRCVRRVPPVVPQAGHRARARAHRSGGRAQHGPDRGNPRASVSHLAASTPTNTPSRASSGWRARSRKNGSTASSSPPSPATARSTTTTTACGRTPRSSSWPSSSRRSSGRGAR